MADLKFACSHCGQSIECDELWSGHQIQCPTCKHEITVPPKPDAPPHATLASAAASQPRLSIGQSRHERSAAPPPPPPQAVTLQQKVNRAKLGEKSSPRKWVAISVAVVVVAVAGYFIYAHFAAGQAEPAKPATIPPQLAKLARAEPAAPRPPKELPMLPAVWTLDVAQAKIPEGKANGSLAGTNFVVETARLDKVGTAYLLRLLQGAPASPDLGFMIYLHPPAGAGVTGQTWTVSQDMKANTVPQIVTLRKTNPRYQAQQKTIFSGYAMKLELGKLSDGVIPGKIFLAVPPDTEQSVVAGVFKANTGLADATTPTTRTRVVIPALDQVPAPAPVAKPTRPRKAPPP